MTDYKVLFTGSVCSGKTTAIRSLSDIETVDTDARVSDSAIRRKKKTTIAMDYGVLDLSDSARLHLYGTPGQERFKFMWEVMMSDLVHDAEGLVLLVDNTRNDPFKDIRFYVEEFRDFIVRRRLIIAVTHSDEKAEPDHDYYMQELKAMGLFTTVIFIDARDPTSVLKIVKELVGHREKDIAWSELEQRLAVNSTMPQANGEGDSSAIEVDEEVTLLEAAMNTRGITGAIHLGADRKVLSSNVSSKQNKELLRSMINLVTALEAKASFLGHIDDLVLYGPQQETLSVFVEEEQALGLCSHKDLSINVVKQQAVDLLQWSRR
ncbi:ATP/GTP-binding protein [Neptuniibacter sp. 1_MG-2023]|uniref:GTP-binding protein n=1 Tax=Neptuniibacter sp. 1_MG-2023 TaxID=3062662 RepID=UPI0026E2E154|nr:ATP/GTP-binding protein [Neptuniibacter sp. 1_MG-2023]MDO6593166.1 ATP/GTP-binding protein [Neptuniibacter sp. 1_MG-2023]